MFVVPFMLSCSAGAIIAYVFLKIPVIEHTLINRNSKELEVKVN